jgi:hypothetical protein
MLNAKLLLYALLCLKPGLARLSFCNSNMHVDQRFPTGVMRYPRVPRTLPGGTARWGINR